MTKFRNTLLIYLLFALTSVLTENISNTAENTLKFVNKAQSEINSTNNSNIILVIGKTGSGKSTLVHYVACDYSKIISIDDEISSDYIVRDGLDASATENVPSSVSRTLIPEVVTDNEQKIWVDCPGFGDTRNTSVEIATAFLIKTIIEISSGIKFVMAVDYTSVTKSYSRDGFDELLSRTTQLIKNVEPFKNSISLVVTKTPSFKIRGKKVIKISESSVKNTTVEFIRDHRTTLLEKGGSENKIQLIDFLLVQSPDGDYPKISIFWRPDDVGPFNEIDIMIDGRQKIRESIINHTSYAEINKNDFGFPLSAGAQIQVTFLSQLTIDSILIILTNISDLLQTNIRRKIESADRFQDKLEFVELGKKCIDLNYDTNALTLNQLVEKLKILALTFNVTDIDMDQFKQIIQHEHNLEILTSLKQNGTIPMQINFHSVFKNTSQLFIDSENQIQNDILSRAKQMIRNIEVNLGYIDEHLFMVLRKKLQTINGFLDKLDLLNLGKNCSRSAGDEVTLKQRIDHFKRLTHMFNVTFTINASTQSIDIWNRVENFENELNYLKSLSKSEIFVPVREWIAISTKVIDYQCSEYAWYSFLDQSYQLLGKYDVQKDVTAFNVAHLVDWGKLNKPQGLFIDENNFNDFIDLVMRGSEFVPKPSRFEELNEIINITLKSPPKYQCSGEMMTIEGVFVKSSDIQLTKCPLRAVKRINVFVIDTFYVDCNLNFDEIEEVELHILSYTWNVIEDTTFRLNGMNGKAPAPSSGNGKPGRPGHLGKNTGNFFGVAYEVVNGHLLTVELIGGQGGDGQDGTGNSDVTVRYSRTYDTKTYGDQDVENYLLNLIKTESGIHHIDVINKEEYFKGVAGVWGAIEYKFTFRLFANKCCGETGLGGPGEKKNYILIIIYLTIVIYKLLIRDSVYMTY